jgi:hypothetical protein
METTNSTIEEDAHTSSTSSVSSKADSETSSLLFEKAAPEVQEKFKKMRESEAAKKQVTLVELTKLRVAQESFAYVRLMNTHMEMTFAFTIDNGTSQ